jgi:hypothetical protein
VAPEDAKRGDQTVDRFADSASTPAEESKVSGRIDGERFAARFKYLELAEFTQDSRGSFLIGDVLKNLAENQIG